MSISIKGYFKNWLQQIQKSSNTSLLDKEISLAMQAYGDFNEDEIVASGNVMIKNAKLINIFHIPFLVVGSIKNFIFHWIDKKIIKNYLKEHPNLDGNYLGSVPTPMGWQFLKGILNISIGGLEAITFLLFSKLLGFIPDLGIDKCYSCAENGCCKKNEVSALPRPAHHSVARGNNTAQVLGQLGVVISQNSGQSPEASVKVNVLGSPVNNPQELQGPPQPQVFIYSRP